MSLKLAVASERAVDRTHQVIGITRAVELAEVMLAHGSRELTDIGRDDRYSGANCVEELVGQREPVVDPPVGVRHQGETRIGKNGVDLVGREAALDLALPGVETGEELRVGRPDKGDGQVGGATGEGGDLEPEGERDRCIERMGPS